MRRCPHCERKTIPLWHAYVSTRFSRPIICSNCMTAVKRIVDTYELLGLVPLWLATFALYYWDVKPSYFGLFFLGYSFPFCISVWTLTFRYKVAQDV